MHICALPRLFINFVHTVKKTILFYILILAATAGASQSSLTANAGPDRYDICPEQSVTLPGEASGGVAPYTFQWSPSTGLNNANIATPVANPGADIYYILTVTDANGDSDQDTLAFIYHPITKVGAGPNVSICNGQTSVTIGSSANSTSSVTFLWSPATGLNDPGSGNPTANPTETTVYTLTASNSTCGSVTSSTTVTVNNSPPIDAGPSQTIKEGDRTSMQATGPEGASFWWSPTASIRYNGSPTADAEPLTTTTYNLMVVDLNGCKSFDTVTIFVEESEEIFVFNAFTPNGDGENDFWIIGNIHKFPESKVQIFNRYGRLVYTKVGYVNEWDGTTFGEPLPAATYYYVIDLGSGKSAYTGDVTIIR